MKIPDLKYILGVLSLLIIFYFISNLLNRPESKNVILIGWDGAERSVFYDLLEKNELPNIKKIIEEGSIIDISVSDGQATVTKPGWSEVLSGYKSTRLKILDNKYYEPIPSGYTIFERLNEKYGKDDIVTTFLTGKESNLSARGPHKVCINCYSRVPDTYERTRWWDEHSDAPLRKGEAERIFEDRDGEPYYHTKNALDFYASDLGPAPNVGEMALGLIEKHKDSHFFMFFHFEEPDDFGHVFMGDSKEYRQGLIDADFWLGQIVTKLKEENLYEKTIIYITSDHGFEILGHDHSKQPNIFGLATNDSRKFKKAGGRIDITPTILDRLGFDIKDISPKIDGESLYRK